MTSRRETGDDLVAEAEILDVIAQSGGFEWNKLGNGSKYRIDAVLHRNNKPEAWIEIKDYKKRLFLGLNVPKFIEGCELAQTTAIPFIFGFRHDGRIGVIKVHGGGAYSDLTPELRMAGGTPKGRTPLPDDYEPMYLFNETDVRWLS